jgi:Tat protein secretion system quality control protein TatD with DNase activity
LFQLQKSRFDEVWDAAYRAINDMYDATKMLKDIAANNYMQSADTVRVQYVHIGSLFHACNQAENVTKFLETASHDLEYALYGPSPPSDISEYSSDDDVFDNLSHFGEMGLDYYEILEKRIKKSAR